MQQSNVIHAIAALLFVSASFGHMYLGTFGLPGAYGAMHGRLRRRAVGQGASRHLVRRGEAGHAPEKFVGGAPQPAPGDD